MTDREPPDPVKISMGEMRFVPAPTAETPQIPPRKGIPWDRIDNWFVAVRSVVVNALLLVSLFAIIGFTVAELRRKVVVIEPIQLPATLLKLGYSEDVAAFRLWDEVVRINQSTPTAKDRVTLLPASQRMDFEAPGAGISLQAVVHVLRPFIGLEETRIAGEFICATTYCKPEGPALRLRVFRNDGMKIISLPPIGDQTNEAEVGRYFHKAALALLAELDPYLVAFYHYQTDKAVARRAALRLTGSTNPQRKWALNLLGVIAADSGDHDAAIDWYQRAIAAAETDEFAIAYANWGDSLRALGDLDGAIVKYRRATELDPENAFYYTNWGNALSDKGDLEGAVAKYTQATKIDPGNVFAYNNWGNALYINRDLDGAIAKYQQATELDPEDALAYYNWGVTLEEKGDLEGAIAKYVRATELDPEDAGAYAKWGVALSSKGDFAEAITKFERATELDPDNAFAYNNWGAALANMGNLDGASEKFMRATELDPDDADAHFNKALALQMQNRAGDAADAFQRYLDLSPDAGNAEQVRAQIEQLRVSATND